MKRKTTVITILVLALCAALLAGCSKYVSSYSAVAMVQSHTSKSVSVSFLDLKGTISYRLTTDDDAKNLAYTAKLDEGSATVYIDTDDKKREFFKLNAGDDISATLENIEAEEIYIIIETNENCHEGSFTFDIVE